MSWQVKKNKFTRSSLANRLDATLFIQEWWNFVRIVAFLILRRSINMGPTTNLLTRSNIWKNIVDTLDASFRIWASRNICFIFDIVLQGHHGLLIPIPNGWYPLRRQYMFYIWYSITGPSWPSHSNTKWLIPFKTTIYVLYLI